MSRRKLTLAVAKERIEKSAVSSDAFDDALRFARQRAQELCQEAQQWGRLIATAEHRERNAVGGYPG